MSKVLIIIIFFCNSIVAQKLGTYELYSSHVDVDTYAVSSSRTFDKQGIILANNKYHALTIAFYGILCLDKFVETNDVSYYSKAQNQFKYFNDNSYVISFDNGSKIGLPYNYDYGGLKAPWFSGMTQGVATSFLLRYYEQSEDPVALDIAKKVINFLLVPEGDGGTISRTPEGYSWIEEYPNRPSSKSVLNGFVNGLMGLKEYLIFFPNDTTAKNIHDNCYNGLFASLKHYDKPNWTSYNRNGLVISNSYLRYQLQEFSNLYHVYNDERFIHQMKIWSKFAINKFPKQLHSLTNLKYQFAIDLTSSNGYKFMDSVGFNLGLINYNYSFKKYKRKISEITLDAKKVVHYIKVAHNLNKNEVKEIKTFIGSVETNHNLVYLNDDLIVESQRGFDQVLIILKERKSRKKISLTYKLYNNNKFVLPLFAICNMKDVVKLSKAKKYRIKVEGNNIVNGRIFYRFAMNREELLKSKFIIENSFPANIKSFKPASDGIYEFFISYDIATPKSKIDKFNLEEYSD